MQLTFPRLSRDSIFTVSLIVIFALGTTLRFIGLNFDLPLITHPDEPKIVQAVVDMFRRRSFEPSEFTWPGHTVIMLGYLIGTVYSYVVLGQRPEAAIDVVGIEHWYLATRIGVALVGSLAILLAYAVGRQFNKPIGLLAATLFAFFPKYVGHSHYATTDMVLATAVLLVVYFAIRYLKSPHYGLVIAMSFAVALAIATKYPGLIAAGMIAIVVGVRALQDRTLIRFVSHGALSLAALALSLFVVSPKLFTERGMVLRSVANESKTVHLGADGLNYVEKLGYYVSDFFSGTALILVVPFIAGIVAVVRRRQVLAIPLLIGVLFWVVLSVLALHWSRWGLPMYLTPLLLSAIGIHSLFEELPARLSRWKRWVSGTLVGISVIATANFAVSSAAGSVSLLTIDTRVIAAEGFRELGINRLNSVYEGYTVDASNYPKRIFTDFEDQAGVLVPVRSSTQFAVTSSSMVGRYLNNPKYVEEQRFYAQLEQQFPLIAEYRPQGGRGSSANPLENIVRQFATIIDVLQGNVTKGPVIKVYDVTSENQ